MFCRSSLHVARCLHSLKRRHRILVGDTFKNVHFQFTCFHFSTNYILNQIIRKESASKGAHLIDFDLIVHRDFGEDFLFLDHFRPQAKYVDEVEELLSEKTNVLLNY